MKGQKVDAKEFDFDTHSFCGVFFLVESCWVMGGINAWWCLKVDIAHSHSLNSFHYLLVDIC